VPHAGPIHCAEQGSAKTPEMMQKPRNTCAFKHTTVSHWHLSADASSFVVIKQPRGTRDELTGLTGFGIPLQFKIQGERKWRILIISSLGIVVQALEKSRIAARATHLDHIVPLF
jgi:hypothetical protein